MIIQKFGGTSLKTTNRIRAVASHIADTLKTEKQIIVVASAMGNHTDELESMARCVSETPSEREMDMLLTAGERISMALLGMALSNHKINALSLTGSQSGILTDNTHGNAKIIEIKGDRINDAFKKYRVVIVAGFQGVDPVAKEITTLGKGGSDLTAVALAKKFGAKRCEIYTDVDGFYNSNPSENQEAILFKNLSWKDAYLLSSHGAGVLHARAALLAYKGKIPLVIRNSYNLSHPGTYIGETSDNISAISTLKNRYSLQIKTFPKEKVFCDEPLYATFDLGMWYFNCSQKRLDSLGLNANHVNPTEVTCHIRPQIAPDNILVQFDEDIFITNSANE